MSEVHQSFKNQLMRVKENQGRLAEQANEKKLQVYGLFKQATEGDNNTKKPGVFDVKERYKWSAWDSKKGMSREQAMKEYIDLTNALLF